MPSSGLFVTLYDAETLNLYLDKGVYGFLMPPIFGEVSPRSRHFAALADYACTREGTHVLFFLKRQIVYGGQVVGSKDFGAFYLNGPHSPMGRKARTAVYWDESKRVGYNATRQRGIFEVPDVGKRCQPYLLRFQDRIGLKGRTIRSDQLYFELGKYNYPLPSNSISGMGFCTLTPGETDIALSLLKTDSKGMFHGKSHERLAIEGTPVAFEPQYGISNLEEAFRNNLFVNEAHLEASILANPSLLPEELRPRRATICRQVPVSPFKPSQMDRADICYYSEEIIRNGTIPNVLIELKKGRAGTNAIEQVERYLKWLYLVIGDQASRISIYLLAPSFACSRQSLPRRYRQQVDLVELGSERQTRFHGGF